MSEVAEAPVQVSAEPQNNQEATNIPVDPFGSNAWQETAPEPKTGEPTKEVVTEVKKETVQQTVETEEILEPKDWLKREFEVEDPEELKQQIKEYRELKSKPQTIEEFNFENEESKKVHKLLREGKIDDVVEIYTNKKKIANAISQEVSESNAADIIKLNMKLKYPALTEEQIDFQYREEYGIPKEPRQRDTETDDEFEERKQDWQEQVSRMKNKAIIAATMAKPDLEKANVNIVLPEEKKQEPVANEPSPEMLKQIRDNFLSKLSSDYTKAEGFSTTVKDESVELPVSFKIPDEDKVALKGVLESDFDVDGYINSRWFSENGEPKIAQIISDLYLLNNTDKVLSGVANNAANQRLVEYRKETSNVSLKNQVNQSTFQPNADGKANISPFAQGAWSEKPPAFN